MRIKIKLFAVLSASLLLLITVSFNTAKANTFEMSIPSFGLYCESENAITDGNVKYVIDEHGKAVQYSQYSINSGIFYIPFISSAFNISEIKTDLKTEICYGSNIGFGNDYKYDFYSSDLNGMTGTVYTLNSTSETFTVDFTMLENQTCICLLTVSSVIRNGKHFTYTVNNAQPDSKYEVFILNGDCTEFKSTAEITKETVTVKEYIDRNFNELKDYYADNGDFTPDIFYALANQAVANNINYDFFDFFIDSFSQMRLNAYKLEILSPCTINYSMPVDVQKNGNFTPSIYKTDQTATDNYSINYTIELNGELPYIIESSAKINKQSDCVYTAESVNGDFYFVFSASEKPKSIYGDNNEMEAWRIALLVVAGVLICVSITILIIIFIKNKKQRR